MNSIKAYLRRNAFPLVCAMAFCVTVSFGAKAAPPELQTDGPIIYLADNLDEKENLGWCIDTLGRGQSDQLQTHSCKPQSGNSDRNADIKFAFDASSGEIRSATYENQCMTLMDANAAVQFGLLDCNGADSQRFTFDEASGNISPYGQPQQCVAAGATSRSAGPYMSRDLGLLLCKDADSTLIGWRILGS